MCIRDSFYYQHATHINLLIQDNKEIFIPFKQPILHLIPLTEREVVVHHHLVSEVEFERDRNRSHQVSFIGSYFKTKKEIENQHSSNCPFTRIFKNNA